MTWSVGYLPEAEKDLASLDRTQRLMSIKAIEKVSQNPLPDSEGGLGKPLGNKRGTALSGFLKIKLKNAGLRIVYRLYRTESRMLIVVIGVREDDAVYDIAQKRIRKYRL